MTWVDIDPNVRVRGNQTYAGFDDVRGMMMVNEAVEVREREAGLVGVARIVDLDKEAELIYLEVDWKSLRPSLGAPADSANAIRAVGVSVIVEDAHAEAPDLALDEAVFRQLKVS